MGWRRHYGDLLLRDERGHQCERVPDYLLLGRSDPRLRVSEQRRVLRNQTTGLTAGTTYYVQVVGVNASTTTVTSNHSSRDSRRRSRRRPTSVSGSSATFNGTVSWGGASTSVTFCFGTSNAVNGVGALTTCTPGSATPGTVTANSVAVLRNQSTGLTQGTTYYVQAVGTNVAGTTYGNVVSFVARGAPVVVTTAATNLAATAARYNGSVSWGGASTVTFCRSASSTVNGAGALGGCSSGAATPGTVAADNVSVLRDVTGLTAATTYYVQAIGVNAAGTTYGNVVSFRTRSAPTVTSVTPATGPLTGLTVVTIRGTGFEGPAGVTIGGTAASGVTVVNSTTITATTPANPVRGTYDVVVTNLDSGSATRAAAFRYVDRNLVRAAAAGRANPLRGCTHWRSHQQPLSGDLRGRRLGRLCERDDHLVRPTRQRQRDY